MRLATNATLVATLFLGLTGLAHAKSETFRIDTSKSVVNWKGTKVIGSEHVGTLKLKDGTVTYKDGQPEAAAVKVDMTSLVNTDLTDATYNAKLVGHLKSDDFFSVDKYPTAELAITNIAKTKAGDYELKGTLTIKGKSKPVSVTAKATNGNEKLITADLVFDRTDFDVKYGSGKFFENLGDKMISDNVSLQVTIAIEKDAIKTASK